MLTNTFCHIPGIGIKKEKCLWDNGIHSWNDFTPIEHSLISESDNRIIQKFLEKSTKSLGKKDINFFAQHLPDDQVWRVYPEFQESIAYVDIETTGLMPAFNSITTIALYDGQSIKHYVSGANLKDFIKDIQRYRAMVTYNGKCFDVPFILKHFGISKMPHLQIDLRFVLKRLGYSGGLKNCERMAGISRQGLEDLDGYFAVLLWNDYQNRKTKKPLETLLAYNIEDVINLEKLMVLSYNLNVGNTPFAESRTIEQPPEFPRPFMPHKRTIQRIKKKFGG